MNIVTIPHNNFNPYFLPGLDTKTKQHLNVDVEKIIGICAEVYGVGTSELANKSRLRKNVDTRNLAMLLMVFLLDMTLVSVSMRFKRDHSTAVCALKTIQKLYQTDIMTRKKVKLAIERMELDEMKYRKLVEFLISDMPISKFRKI